MSSYFRRWHREATRELRERAALGRQALASELERHREEAARWRLMAGKAEERLSRVRGGVGATLARSLATRGTGACFMAWRRAVMDGHTQARRALEEESRKEAVRQRAAGALTA